MAELTRRQKLALQEGFEYTAEWTDSWLTPASTDGLKTPKVVAYDVLVLPYNSLPTARELDTNALWLGNKAFVVPAGNYMYFLRVPKDIDIEGRLVIDGNNVAITLMPSRFRYRDNVGLHDYYYLTTGENRLDHQEYDFDVETTTKWQFDTITKVEIEAGAAAFTELTDTPADYTDQKGKIPTVKTDETGLEFQDPSGGASTFAELTDTPSTYRGSQNLAVVVNSTANGLAYSPLPTPTINASNVIPIDRLCVLDKVAGKYFMRMGWLFRIPDLTASPSFLAYPYEGFELPELPTSGTNAARGKVSDYVDFVFNGQFFLLLHVFNHIVNSTTVEQRYGVSAFTVDGKYVPDHSIDMLTPTIVVDRSSFAKMEWTSSGTARITGYSDIREVTVFPDPRNVPLFPSLYSTGDGELRVVTNAVANGNISVSMHVFRVGDYRVKSSRGKYPLQTGRGIVNPAPILYKTSLQPPAKLIDIFFPPEEFPRHTMILLWDTNNDGNHGRVEINGSLRWNQHLNPDGYEFLGLVGTHLGLFLLRDTKRRSDIRWLYEIGSYDENARTKPYGTVGDTNSWSSGVALHTPQQVFETATPDEYDFMSGDIVAVVYVPLSKLARGIKESDLN